MHIVHSASFLFAMTYCSKTFISARRTKATLRLNNVNGHVVSFGQCINAVFECDSASCRYNKLTAILLVAAVTGWGTVNRGGGRGGMRSCSVKKWAVTIANNSPKRPYRW